MKFVGPSKSATAHKPSCNVAKDSVSHINLKMNLSRPLHLSGGPDLKPLDPECDIIFNWIPPLSCLVSLQSAARLTQTNTY